MKNKNILRRMQCLCFSLLLILSMFSAMPVYATGTTEVVFGEVTTRVSDEVIVPVFIKNNPGITSFRFRVSYDADKFEFVSATKGSMLTTGMFSDTTDTTAETMTFQWFAEENVYGDGTIVELKFKILENIRGEHILNVTYLENDIINEGLEVIPFIVTTGKITVICNDLEHQFDDDFDADCNNCVYQREPKKHGDANSDGTLNNQDLATLMQYINGWNVQIDIAAADVNADGKINNKDYVLLMRYINGWNVELK